MKREIYYVILSGAQASLKGIDMNTANRDTQADILKDLGQAIFGNARMATEMTARNVSVAISDLEQLINTDPVGVRFSGNTRHLASVLKATAENIDKAKVEQSALPLALAESCLETTGLLIKIIEFMFQNESKGSVIENLMRSLMLLQQSVSDFVDFERAADYQDDPIAQLGPQDANLAQVRESVPTGDAKGPFEVFIHDEATGKSIRYVRADLYEMREFEAQILQNRLDILDGVQLDALGRTQAMIDKIESTTQPKGQAVIGREQEA
jgi:hypothetical protein